jgi:3-hydroxyisobutyrate dehydrogenase
VKPTIGFVGVGRMGLPACRRLVEPGYDVIAGDLRAERQRPVRAAGAKWAGLTHRVASAADVLVTMLPGTTEMRDAMEIAIPALRPGATWIDMTTASPEVGRELAARAVELDLECVDAPVGGGPGEASAGSLQMFVGGPAEAVERNRRLLEVLGRIVYVGPEGTGYVTKLLVNLLWFGQAVAAGEALLLARRCGIDLDSLGRAVNASAAANEFIAGNLGRLVEGDYLQSFGLDRCCEELDAVAALATELAVPFELSTQVLEAYRRALDRYGAVDGELLAIALLEERAGIRLRG